MILKFFSYQRSGGWRCGLTQFTTTEPVALATCWQQLVCPSMDRTLSNIQTFLIE